MSKILKQLAALSQEAGTPSGDAGALQLLTDRVQALKPVAAEHVVEMGALLKEIKATLGHGSFVGWLTDVAGMTRSTATKYMRASELTNIAVLEPLGVEKLYILRSLPNVDELTPDTRLPVPPTQTPKTLLDMSTRELRAAVQAIAPGRPVRRAMRRDLVQRYLHLRDELGQVVEQLNNGDDAARARFERSTGHPPERAAEVAGHLP